MTKLKNVLFGFFGAYLLLAMPLANAQNAPRPVKTQEEHLGQRVQKIYNQLGLTDDQKKQLESNKQDHRAKMQASRQAMKASMEALKAEIMKSQLDMPKVNAIHNQIKALESQMEDEKLNSILAVRTILTPDQFTKFVNLMQKHKEGHGEEEAEHHEQE